MSKSTHAEPGESSPYNHHLQQFLTFLKQERGFAEATILNRQRSLKPFLDWLVGQGVSLSAVSSVVITKYFTSRFFVMWAVEVGPRRASLSPSTHPDYTLTKICRKGRRGKM